MSGCGHTKDEHKQSVCFGQESNGDMCWCHEIEEPCPER